MYFLCIKNIQGAKMANVWVGENYYIKNIYVKESRYFDSTLIGDAANVTANAYLTILQRLPESNYSAVTEVEFNPSDHNIASGLSDDDLVNVLIPKINTALAVDDASASAEAYTPTALDNYTLKL